MTRYERECQKRDVIHNGKMIGRRQPTVEQATRELSAAFTDAGEQLMATQARFARRINALWRGR